MPGKQINLALGKTVYPLTASVTMIAAAILLSFVDLTFLNEVIGKVLDAGPTLSMAVAFALGLVGIGLMAHQGVRMAHRDDKLSVTIILYTLWTCFGIALVFIRLFSATILGLDSAVGDQSLISISSLNFRQIDLVLAPVMFFLYLATGFMVMDGVKNLYLNPEFDKWKESRRKSREELKIEAAKLKAEAALRIERLRNDAEKEKDGRIKAIKEQQLKDALEREYTNALREYRMKERELKETHQKISANIDYVKNIDKQENEFESKVKPSLMKIVTTSINSAQNSVALTIRKKTNEDLSALRHVIDTHNNQRHG